MITTLVLLCMSLLDMQQMPPVPDSLEKQFTVHELREMALTGCTSNPQSGGPTNHQIFIDVVNHNDPHDGTSSAATSLTASGFQEAMDNPAVTTIPSMMPYDPPSVPDPNPETPPVAVVPEPPTLAILTISVTVLLYLLFGRKRERLYRRS